MNSNSPQQHRAVIYTRVSSDEQVKGYGLEYQLEDCRRAIAQHGHRLLRVYSDPGISGTLEDRPGLNQLRHDAQEREFDIVYFWKSDRLARDEILQLTLYREFRRLGLETYSVSEPNMNDLMRGIYAVFGAEDLRNIKAKTFSGRLRAMRAGKWIGAPPYGYMKDAEFKLVPNPKEAPWVKKLFEWLVDDHLSLYALTKKAYDQRIPTWYDTRERRKRINGNTYWSAGTIGHLLHRDYYATGEAQFTVRPHLGQVSAVRNGAAATEDILVPIPPLISPDLFQRAQEQLRRNSEYSPRAAKHVYLFAKKVRCGFCGLKLAATLSRVKNGRPYYRANRVSREQPCRRCGCRPERVLDDAVWPHIVSFFSTPEAFMAKLEAYRMRGTMLPDVRSEQAALEKTVEKLHEQEKALLGCQLEGF